MSICYAIKDWDKHFENSESRKIKSLTWVPVKNKHDGKGYRRVCQHPKSIQVFCAWNLLVQVASKMPVRGLLRDDDGPLTTSDLSAKTGYPESIFEAAFQSLADPKVGWLVVVNSGNREILPAAPESSQGVGTEQNGMEHNGTEVIPPPSKGDLEKGSGEKPPVEPPFREIPTEDEAFAMTMSANVDEAFVRYVYRQWAAQAGKNANGISVEWLVYVVNRWKNEQIEWRNETHRGNRKNTGRLNPRNVGVAGSVASKNRDVQAVLARRNQTQTHATP